LARRANIIKDTRNQSQHVLLLDAGNALWSQQPLTQQTEGKVVIDAMNLLGYDAMAIGDLDLQLGLDVLRSRLADSKFPVLSANVMVAGESKLLTQPYVVLERGDHKVGIIGLTWDQAMTIDNQLTLLKASEVLPKYVAEVGQQADVVIVLSNMGWDEDLALASSIPGIDLIVGGRSRIPMPESQPADGTGTLVVQAGSQGEWVGRRILTVDGAGQITARKDELLYLTEDYADDAEMRAFLDNYQP
jgi:2',3'-cyclic-nucleotide 2'-phosphodiesterase (5'-nucleotidase family)